MNKQEFLTELKKKLSGLPKKEIEERLAFYGEMIDDKIEEGRTEESAVAELGTVDKIASQIIADIPFAKIAKERMKPSRKFKTWEIVLLALGSPIWLSLAVAAFAIVLSLYAVLLSLAVSLWAVFVSLAVCGVVGSLAGIVFAITGFGHSGVFILGASLVCAGLSIFLFFGCKLATKGVVFLAKKIALGIKKSFMKKEAQYE